MNAYEITLTPLTAFGTPLVGDTLFGQLCWSIRELFGNDKLNHCLEGYTEGNPFLILSDAYPTGYLKLPTLPPFYWEIGDSRDYKALKQQVWLPLSVLKEDQSTETWQASALNTAQLMEKLTNPLAKSTKSRDQVEDKKNSKQETPVFSTTQIQMHNTINRATNTTGISRTETEGAGQFAPYSIDKKWYHPALTFTLYLLLDPDRLSPKEVEEALTLIGLTGYGRDASTGLGKMAVEEIKETTLFEKNQSNSQSQNTYFTLAPTSPQGLDFKAKESFYLTQTRFGRHGNLAATSDNPFKKPLLMAQSGAVFTPQAPPKQPHYLGQGIIGISNSHDETLQKSVHQGYAPVLPFALDMNRFNKS